MGTPREQLAAALKKARLEAGYDSHGKLAKAIMLSRSVVAKAESPSQAVPSDVVLAAWAKTTGVAVEEFTELAQRAKNGTPEWFMPYLSAEQVATSLRFWGPTVVPGLLQTEAYARALSSAQRPTAEQLAAMAATRAERQQVIGRARITAVIDAGVLQRCVGSPAVMAEQLARLAELVESGKISLHVVPEGANVALGGAHVIALHNGSAMVSLTTTIRDITSTAPDVVEETLTAFDSVLGAALAAIPSLEFTRRMEETWKER